MAKRDEKAVVSWWLGEIQAAKKRESQFRKMGETVLKIYEADESDEVPFNILYSNTETLLPALYSSQPRPVVLRRFKDEDPMAKHVADAGRRMLEYLTDTNVQGYESFHEGMLAGTLDALLPGRGVTRVKYDAEFATLAEPRPPQQDDDDPAGKPKEEPAEYAQWETVCVESLTWNRVLFGYAKKWQHVPWVAYEFYVTKEEAVPLIGKANANKLKYTTTEQSDEDGEKKRRKEEDHAGGQKRACLYQIWDRAGGKKVRYVSPNYKDEMLGEEEDPLQLTGFFNCPRPLQFVAKTHSLTPTAPYKLYKNQAKELNRLTQRINKIVEAIKARGVYDGNLSDDLSKLFDSDDNTLIAAGTASSLATEKGFQNAIWFLPIEQLIAVLVQLFQARESCKQVIYEITGISDILRGSSKASETATAQDIKAKWGGLRIQRLQADVQRYARDLLRMMLELAATKFSVETWANVTGLPFLTQQQATLLQQQLQAAQATGQQPDPQLVARLQSPIWEHILAIMRDDMQRAYKIDIETNSTIAPEAAEDQKAIAELMGAMGQVLNGLGPLVAKGVMPFEAAQALLLFVARRFRYGQEIEDYIKAMKPPQPEGDGGEAAKQQLEAQQKQAEQEIGFKQKQAEMAVQEKAMQAEMEQKQREMDIQLREMQLKLDEQKMQIQRHADQQQLQVKTQAATEQLGFQQKKAQLENSKYKTENVVNQKADQTLGTGIKAMQSMVEQLVKAVAQQSQQHHQMLEAITGTLSKPRMKRAIRGQDGRIEAVEERVA
jgi:hypothetical protein